MRHRRSILSLAVLVLTLLLPCSVLAQQQGVPAYVTHVVDGDTFYAAVGNQMESVRYIGLNAPEIHHPTKGPEPYGEKAKEANRRLIEGKWVTLFYDVQVRDRFGRLLAYVYVGDTFANAALVWWGWAEAATYPPDVRYATYFRDLERKAREANRGLWGDPEAVAYHRPRAAETPAGATTMTSPTNPTTITGDTGASVGAGRVWSTPAQGPGASSTPSGDVSVHGYTRSDGTYVPPYTRAAPGRGRR